MEVQAKTTKRAKIAFRIPFAGEENKLLNIERACFPCPWTRDEFQSDFHLTVGFFIHDPDQVFGYLATRRWGNAVVIENIAIAPAHQRCNYGRRFLELASGFIPALGPLHSRRASKPDVLHAWVWERNYAAQLFFAACGFKASKEVRNFYLDDSPAAGDSAILFAKPLGQVAFEKFPVVRLAQ